MAFDRSISKRRGGLRLNARPYAGHTGTS
jgi:hypothetical protein